MWSAKNSESLRNSDVLLSHLDISKRNQLAASIAGFPCLFGGTPTRTHVVEHNIDVGDSKSIKQRFYRVHPEKRKLLDAELKYMLVLV